LLHEKALCAKHSKEP